MPQSIYQGLTDAHSVDQRINLAPDGWAYIGQTVQGFSTLWEKTPVWNRIGNNWVQLNAALDRVDYMLRDLKHNQVTLEIVDHQNYDFLDYELTVTSSAGTTVVSLPDDTVTYRITELTENTEYTVNLRARLLQAKDKWTNDSIQRFTTPENPIPLAPINLVSAWRTNSYMDLAWTNPVDSTATSFNVYVGTDSTPFTLMQHKVVGTTSRVTGLSEDRKYKYRVTGVNDEGMEGPPSNTIRWATGHDEKRRRGNIDREPLHPHEWGSWRPDIGWIDWKELWYNNRRVLHYDIYQGYWQKDPVWTGSTVGINRPEQESGRYRGVVTYNTDEFRQRLESRHGSGVPQNLNVSLVEIRRVYRQAGVGSTGAVNMEWYLTNTNVHDSGSGPPIYFGHRNETNSADSVAAHLDLRAGAYHDFLRLPRGYGHALASGTGWYGPNNGVAVNGIMLYRGDHTNTGAGAAGYGRWGGHGRRDPSFPRDAWRVSDWTIHITASWDFAHIPYLAPYQW